MSLNKETLNAVLLMVTRGIEEAVRECSKYTKASPNDYFPARHGAVRKKDSMIDIENGKIEALTKIKTEIKDRLLPTAKEAGTDQDILDLKNFLVLNYPEPWEAKGKEIGAAVLAKALLKIQSDKEAPTKKG